MKHILLIIITLFSSLCLSAQSQDVTLVVSGQGNTREEATANALRSAIEQSYGVFVSANTQILNDEIVKDEIATVASGNVKEYKELSCMTMPNGMQSVTLSATVSISNLISYAKSHGSSAEFAGQTFGMNIKMRHLNTENELKALIHLKNQVAMMARNIYDYSIEVIGEPRLLDNGNYEVRTLVTAKGNENYNRLINIITSTLKSLSLPQSQVEAWHRNNMKTSTLNWVVYNIIPERNGYYNPKTERYFGYNFCHINNFRRATESKSLKYALTTFNEHKYFFRNKQLVLDIIYFDILRYLTLSSLAWEININGLDISYSVDVLNLNTKTDDGFYDSVSWDITGTCIPNTNKTLINQPMLRASIKATRWDVESKFRCLPDIAPTVCFPIVFQLNEEELFSTNGFEVGYDSKPYEIASTRDLTEIYCNLPEKLSALPDSLRFLRDTVAIFNIDDNYCYYHTNYNRGYTFKLDPSLSGTLSYSSLDLRIYHDDNNCAHFIYLDQSFYELINIKNESYSSTELPISRDEVMNNNYIKPSYGFIGNPDRSQKSEKPTVDDKIDPSQAYENPGTNDETAASQTVPFQLVQEKPSFMGGDANAFSKWVNQRLVYPEEAKAKGIQGRVALEFTIDVNGAVKDVKVLKGIEASLDAEAVRVVSMSPEWTPGKNDGQPVAVTYRFPVIFQTK